MLGYTRATVQMRLEGPSNPAGMASRTFARNISKFPLPEPNAERAFERLNLFKTKNTRPMGRDLPYLKAGRIEVMLSHNPLNL